MFYRMIKPNWAVPLLLNKDPNPAFKKQIKGPRIIEGCLELAEVMQLNQLGYNAYWFPNHPATNVYKQDNVKYLNGKLITNFNYIFLDMDLKEGIYPSISKFLETLAEFKIKPTLTIKSGHGVHAYWKINQLTREDYLKAQFALIKHFHTDDSVWSVLQLMRVPGTLNTKELDNQVFVEPVEVLSSSESYNLEVFPAELFDLPEMTLTKIKTHIDRLEGRTLAAVLGDLSLDDIPDSFLKLISEDEGIHELFHDPIGAYGDRSGADMKLANLLFQKKFPKKEALQVIANTHKAHSKGSYRAEYAQTTIDKAYVERTLNKFLTVGQMLRTGQATISNTPINGPAVFDCLVNRWAKKQILGLVAGSGTGKTAVSLFIIKSIIENNPDNDDVSVFISLEMPASEVIDRWIQLVGQDSPLADRLYVIDTEEHGTDNQRVIGLQEIYEYCTDIKVASGKEIGAVIIDHIGITSKHIDTKKDYTFGVESEQMAGWGDQKTMSLANLATQLKTLAKMLNVFLIPLTQTTKAKGLGYTPLGKDAAFGVSQYANIVDYMITLWQPLMLVQDQLETRFLAWQYAKLRHQHKDDIIKPNSYKLLIYNMATGDILAPEESQFQEFARFLPVAQERARLKENKIEVSYSRSISPEDLLDIDKKLKLINCSAKH